MKYILNRKLDLISASLKTVKEEETPLQLQPIMTRITGQQGGPQEKYFYVSLIHWKNYNYNLNDQPERRPSSKENIEYHHSCDGTQHE